MFIGLIGKKISMTRIFDSEGKSIPVTVLEIGSNYISQIKTKLKDNYSAVQLASGNQKQSRLTKSQIGNFVKSKIQPAKYLKEFRVNKDVVDLSIGQELTLASLGDERLVDICAYSKGKGFQGGIKRHNFNGQDRSHGNSLSHRAIGSVGQCQDPGRVFKGKKMPGHMGVAKVSRRGVQVVQKSEKLLFLKGSVPGAKGSLVILKPSKG